MVDFSLPAPSPNAPSLDSSSPAPSPNAPSLAALVGIGASAGGLEAIASFISALDPSWPAAYVVLQHLSPHHKSMLAEILARETKLPVVSLLGETQPQPGTVYVLPANRELTIANERLIPLPHVGTLGPTPSINRFFQSLAEGYGERAIGVLLSGTGSDGAVGLQTIRYAGGIALVQDPKTAKFDAMPRAAIEADAADFIAAPTQLARRVGELFTLVSVETKPDPLIIERLQNLLQSTNAFDFSGYKPQTIWRRFRKRMVAAGFNDPQSYLDHCAAHPLEFTRLTRELLVSVTRFFRDPEAFEALRHHLTAYLQRHPNIRELRVWSIGCATGEEAYSLAMLLLDLCDTLNLHPKLVVFATDIDEFALSQAREGRYPKTISDQLPPGYLDRFFIAEEETLQIAKVVRDIVIFARHNILTDPPFLRLDLIACRNLLIYLEPPAQDRVLKLCQFSLNPEGILFLGRSEGIGRYETYFTPLTPSLRLFEKSSTLSNEGEIPSIWKHLPRTSERRPSSVDSLLWHKQLDHLATILGVTILLLTSDRKYRHIWGDTTPLRFPKTADRLDVGALLPPELLGPFELLWKKVTRDQTTASIELASSPWKQITLTPTAGDQWWMILHPSPPSLSPSSDAVPQSAVTSAPLLDLELGAMRARCDELVAELAQRREELELLHEEAQALQEELQASNEELEASNEELQATNEELTSLNEELRARTAELTRLNAEYVQLYDALDFPLLVFDAQLRLSRFNAAAARHLQLRPHKLATSAADLPLGELFGENHAQRFFSALTSGDPLEYTVFSAHRTWQIRLVPSWDAMHRITALIAMAFDVTAREQAYRALAEAELNLRTVLDHTQLLFALKSPEGFYRLANPRYRALFGIADDYSGQNDHALLPPAIAQTMVTNDLAALRARAPVKSEYRTPDGLRLVAARHHPIFDPGGALVGFLFEGEDITEQRAAEQQLRIAARVFDQAGEAIAVTDPNTIILSVNEAFCRITGYTREEAIGRPVAALLKSGRHSADFYRDMWARLNKFGFWQGEIWNRRKSGDIYPEWLSINRIVNRAGETEVFVAVFSDITDLKESQRKLEYLATHDPLTGLANRALFLEQLRSRVAHLGRYGGQLALLMFDLDGFKTVNDTLGHDTGDALLKAVAQRLRELVRDLDTLARLGGDEFALIIENVPPSEIALVADRCLNALAQPFTVADRHLTIGTSIGIALMPEDAKNVEELLQFADTALYRAKELGRNRAEWFSSDLRVKMLKRAAIESGLRAALSTPEGRFELHYQPIVSLADGRWVAAEALLRWRDPELGPVSPAEFIPIAEEGGLISAITDWVLDTALAQIAAWDARNLPLQFLAINISFKDLYRPTFAARIAERLTLVGIPPQKLLLELTEAAFAGDNGIIQTNLTALAQLGVNLAIDDFGVGYSSLARLKRFSVSEIKIDRSFISDIGKDPTDETLVRAILAMADALGIAAVAEGIETEEHETFLCAHRCPYGQGFRYAPPLPPDLFAQRWIALSSPSVSLSQSN
ncbi:MAG: EAL domain-containing protein [Hydrogenophilus sp.]|nr:EAL domain-containing protein [Hydrogenophilus sp.]